MMMETKESLVWSGCSPCVSRAIGVFYENCRALIIRPVDCSMADQIKRDIDPAVRQFSAALSGECKACFSLAFGGVPSIGRFVKKIGLDATALRIRDVLWLFFNEKLHNEETDQEREFVATLETLAWLLGWCAVNEYSVRAQRYGSCQICNLPTEVSMFVQESALEPISGVGYLTASDILKLSKKYCAFHKSRISGIPNPAYRWEKRNKNKMVKESDRLRQDVFHPDVSVGDGYPDAYVWGLKAALSVGSEEKTMLYRVARDMVRRKISDRKKQILVLVARGLNQSEISKKIGVSRQAISQALKSIPDSYRCVVVKYRQDV